MIRFLLLLCLLGTVFACNENSTLTSLVVDDSYVVTFEGYVDTTPPIPTNHGEYTYVNSTVYTYVLNPLQNSFYIYLLRNDTILGDTLKTFSWSYYTNISHPIRVVSMYSSTMKVVITSYFEHCVPDKVAEQATRQVSPNSMMNWTVIGVIALLYVMCLIRMCSK